MPSTTTMARTPACSWVSRGHRLGLGQGPIAPRKRRSGDQLDMTPIVLDLHRCPSWAPNPSSKVATGRPPRAGEAAGEPQADPKNSSLLLVFALAWRMTGAQMTDRAMEHLFVAIDQEDPLHR
jgi:hypothetical protein